MRPLRNGRTYFEVGRRVLGVGERKFHGQSHSSNCCLSNHSRQLRPGPLPPLQGKRRSPGCLNGFGLGWEEADSVSSPTPVALNLWLGGRRTAASRRRPNSPPIGPSPPGRGLGRAAPARCEARTSGIPREDSEVLSAVGLMARPRWTGKAWTCLLPARKCCEVSASVFSPFVGRNLSSQAWPRERGLQESSPGLVPGGKGMGSASRRGSCL